MTFRLMTLGAPLELVRRGGESCKVPNTKHLALLAYLTLEPGEHARDWLTRFIWSSGEAGSMNDAVYTLRGIFGPEVIPARVREIAFDPALVECDARELLAVAGIEGEEVFGKVLALYRGPFLDGFNTRGASSRFVNWMERRRAEFERIFLDASRRALQTAAGESDWKAVQGFVEEILKRVPSWPDAAAWLRAAEELRDRSSSHPGPPSSAGAQAAALPSVPSAPTPAFGGATREPSLRRSPRAWLIVLVTALAGGLALFAVMRAPEHDRAAPTVSAASGPVAQGEPCSPGEASAELIEEVFHYGVRVRGGRPFAKRWTLQNTGDCAWDTRFRLHRVSGDEPRLSSTMMDVPLKRQIPPGDTLMLVLPMRAPTAPGAYEEIWQLRDAGNRPVAVGDKNTLVAMIRVPLPHYPTCRSGEGSAALILKKYPDGTVLRPSEPIRWSWVLRNNGECAWGESTVLGYVSNTGGRLSRVDSVVTNRSIEPGETYTFLVPMWTPNHPGAHVERWTLRAGAGHEIAVDGLPSVDSRIRVQAADVPVTVAPICAPGTAQLRFVDENWPDSSTVPPGREFTKRWTVVNMGTCAWGRDYRLRYVSNTAGQLAQSTSAKPLGEIVPPNAAYTFEVPMRTQSNPGFYREDWEFVDNAGNRIMIGTAPYLAALIIVSAR